MKHGLSGYTRGCRCGDCKAAKSAYDKERIQEVKAGTRAMNWHGISGYNRGCRCDLCRVAMREYQRARAGVRVPRPGEHGTGERYAAGCRCTICAGSERRREIKRRNWERTGGPGIKTGITHNLTGYTYHWCRCEVCRAAGRTARKPKR